MSYPDGVTQYGRYPAPDHVIAHLSDTHLVSSEPLFGALRSEDTLLRALDQLERSGTRPEAIVFTGDLTDRGDEDSYRRLRTAVEPAAARMGARIVWVMGNHDERLQFASGLFDEDGVARPQDRTYDLAGLRIVALDTSVPGYHHGDISADQLDWLRSVLAAPAPHGTILALHHPPIPTPLELMSVLELRHQDALADAIRGSDVRAILGGHLHYSTHSTFAGVPVSVVGSLCYTIDVSAPQRTLSGIGGGQSFNLVQVYSDRIVHCTVPVGDIARVSGFDAAYLDALDGMTPEQRLEAFSKKRTTVPAPEPPS